ncbi:MAG: hypothetical protein ACREQ5_35495, partial [Candidatus Dormibacteria bacterium]
MAANNEAEVKLGADTGAATASFADAASKIKESIDGLRSAFSGFGADHSKAVKEAIANNANLSRSFIELRGSAQQGFNIIGGVLARIRGLSLELTAVLAGGALFSGAIKGAEDLE